jgi:hypothetical protein
MQHLFRIPARFASVSEVSTPSHENTKWNDLNAKHLDPWITNGSVSIPAVYAPSDRQEN